ncbi:AraC family transcriptional regulator [Variovorax terrae]|uniref:AraC family transcriptional regulator n=1 Tax=Variovorax terrae TaxID=2923278 RepID=A0A9X1VQ45_9BURK|nr:AraC family transcriptional regulator [Variovorax terrae]MCJ0761741.1 AraC family transcriptional regulator [Variovorax terrae]
MPAARTSTSPARPAPSDLSTGPAVTPMALVAAVVRAYRQYGKDPSGALHLAQITPESVRDPAARVTARQMEAVSAAAMQELDDEALGWFRRPLPWGSYGMLARASLTSPDLGVALRRWCRHHGLLTDDVVFSLSITGQVATLTLAEHQDLGRQREICLVYLLRNAHGLASWYIDSRIALLEVGLPFAAPPHRDAYDTMFGTAVQFGAAQAQIRFDARYLRQPLRRDEAALRQMLRRALPLAVLQYRRDRLLVQRVRQLLATQGPQAQNADTLAALLNVSARTLHRQLKEEGASLQQIKDEVRRERAVALLHRTRRPIKQVAQEVGFRNEKSFIRAFRGWTGQAPAAFRRLGGPAEA